MLAPTESKEENQRRLGILKNAVVQENTRLDKIVAEKKSELDEYRALMNRLTELPKKLQHHIMVPFGSVGFMPGRIVRTNEVMMLVGDGYFVERSTFEANEALSRRTEVIEKILTDCDAEKKLISEQLVMAERLFNGEKSEEVEIREEYNEEEEAKFKARRQQRIAHANSQAAPKATDSELDIVAHLEKLEMLEAENNELQDEEEVEEEPLAVLKPPPGVSEEDFRRLLARMEEESSSDGEYDSSLDGEEESDALDSDDVPPEEENRDKYVLSESAKANEAVDSSKAAESSGSSAVPSGSAVGGKKKGKKRASGVRFATELERTTTIRSHEPVTAIEPLADTRPSGPILKNKDAEIVVDRAAISQMESAERKPRVVEGSRDAFNGIVVERSVDVFGDGCEPVASTSADASSSQPAPRVSKFKQRRNRH